MKACKTPVCYVAKNTNLTHCHSPPTQLKLQEKGGTVTRPLQVLHTLQWHHPGGRALGNWLKPPRRTTTPTRTLYLALRRGSSRGS